MERKLASVRKIEEVKPIVGADKICAYRVGGWWVVDAVNKYNVGDLVTYPEIDSFLPIRPQFEFLRKTSYKKLSNGDEGFRLKTIKLRGQISQGLLTAIPEGIFNPKEGDDLTEALDIVKYEPPIPAQLAGEVKGLFPSFIPKTDEIRVQIFEKDMGFSPVNEKVYISEKLDGSSATFYYYNGEFGVCSRNLELKESDKNALWIVAKRYDLPNKLKFIGKNLAIQGEILGPSIQGNPYKLKDVDVYFFTAYDIDNACRLSFEGLETLTSHLGVKMVPVLEKSFVLPTENLVDNMLAMADGKSKLHGETDREGIVVRGLDKTFSFKSISNAFLLKHD